MTEFNMSFRFPWQRGLQGRLTLISLLFALVPQLLWLFSFSLRPG